MSSKNNNKATGNNKGNKAPRKRIPKPQQPPPVSSKRALAINAAYNKYRNAEDKNHKEAMRLIFNYVHRMLDPESCATRDFLIPRDVTVPMASRSIPYTAEITAAFADNYKSTAIRMRPNPNKILSVLNPPSGGRAAKDALETMELAADSTNPVAIFIDHPLTTIQGSISCNRSPVIDLVEGVYYSSSSNAYKEGQKWYASGPVIVGDAWTVQYTNNHSYKLSIVRPYFTRIFNGPGGPTADLTAVATTNSTFNCNPSSAVTLAVPTGWDAFAAAMALPDTLGFSYRLEITVANHSDGIHRGDSVSLVWGATKPIFGSAYTWSHYSLWNLLGAEGEGLHQEWLASNGVAITQYSCCLTNGTAILNKNGFISAAQISPNEDFEYNTPKSIMSHIDSRDTNRKTKISFSANDGLNYVYTPAIVEEWDLRPPTDYDNVDDFGGAFYSQGICSIDCQGALDSSPSILFKVSGFINIEFRTARITLPKRSPPSDYIRFNSAYVAMASKIEVFSENPKHWEHLKKMAKRIVQSDIFKNVARQAVTVGSEMFLSMLV